MYVPKEPIKEVYVLVNNQKGYSFYKTNVLKQLEGREPWNFTLHVPINVKRVDWVLSEIKDVVIEYIIYPDHVNSSRFRHINDGSEYGSHITLYTEKEYMERYLTMEKNGHKYTMDRIDELIKMI